MATHGCEPALPSLVLDPLGGSMPLHRQLYQELGPAQAGPPSRSIIERFRERVGFGNEVSSASGWHVPSVSPRYGVLHPELCSISRSWGGKLHTVRAPVGGPKMFNDPSTHWTMRVLRSRLKKGVEVWFASELFKQLSTGSSERP